MNGRQAADEVASGAGPFPTTAPDAPLDRWEPTGVEGRRAGRAEAMLRRTCSNRCSNMF